MAGKKVPGKKFIVAPGAEFNYAADEVTEKLITNAGGRRNLTDEQLGMVKFKTVSAGEDCSDMRPKETMDLYISRGWIIEAEAPKPEVVEEEVDNE